MSRVNRSSVALLSMAVLLVSACSGSGSRTTVNQAVRAVDLPNAPYKHVLVIGVSKKESVSRNFEVAMARELGSTKTRATPYHQQGSAEPLSEEVVAGIAIDLGADAVIVTSVKHLEANSNLHTTRTAIEARPIGGERLVDYFRYDYEEYVVPTTVALTYDVVLITDLYDVASRKKVYSLESSTTEVEHEFEVIEAESVVIARRMREDGLVR